MFKKKRKRIKQLVKLEILALLFERIYNYFIRVTWKIRTKNVTNVQTVHIPVLTSAIIVTKFYAFCVYNATLYDMNIQGAVTMITLWSSN